MSPPDPAAARGPAACAQAQLDAYNAGDAEAFAACFADEVDVYRLPETSPSLTGRGALRESYAALFAAAPTLRAVATKRLVQGDYVIDQEAVTDHPRGVTRAVAIYQVADGLIRRVWFLM